MQGKTPAEFAEELRTEFPRFRVVRNRDSILMRSVDILIRILTFNAYRRFLTSHIEVVGQAVYVPDIYFKAGNRTKIYVYDYARIHMREMRRYTVLGALVLRAWRAMARKEMHADVQDGTPGGRGTPGSR